MALSAIPSVLGWCVIGMVRPEWGTSMCLAVLVVGRVLCGLGVGIQSATVPVYVAEVSPAKMRGFLGCFVQIHIAIGVTLVYLLGCVRI